MDQPPSPKQKSQSRPQNTQSNLASLVNHKHQKLITAEVPLLNALDCWMSFCILVLVAGTALYVEPVSKGPVLSVREAVRQDSSRSRCEPSAQCSTSRQGTTGDFVNGFSMAIMVPGRNSSSTCRFYGDWPMCKILFVAVGWPRLS